MDNISLAVQGCGEHSLSVSLNYFKCLKKKRLLFNYFEQTKILKPDLFFLSILWELSDTIIYPCIRLLDSIVMKYYENETCGTYLLFLLVEVIYDYTNE